MCYYYNKNEIKELRIDRKMIDEIGFFFASEILSFVQHPEKKEKTDTTYGKTAIRSETNKTRALCYHGLLLRSSTHRGPLAMSQRKERSTAGQ